MLIAIAYLTNPEYDSKNILYGQIIGFWILTIACFIVAQSLFFIPKESAKWLGLVPITFGLVKLLTYTNQGLKAIPNIRSTGRQIQEMSLLTVATGADDVMAYTPIFATRKPHEITILFVMFTLMTVLWWLIAKWLANRKVVRKLIYKCGPALVPLLMITIGVIVLSGD